MKPKHLDLLIPKDGTNPFVNCKLNRKQYADVLTDIINIYEDGFVLAINNKWGTGKTTFIKMWKQQLDNNKFQTLYFNAWENDFQKDVLIALLAELEVLRDSKTKVKFKNVLKKATPLLKSAGLGLIKGLAKKAGADEMLQAIIDGSAEATLKGLENELESYTNRKKGIEDFRESLTKYVELLGKGKPVVFIIDELDRCRPSYAVEILEQVKHLFSVLGIVFVLVIDKEQLGHAIRGVYGSDKIDADEYLRRFIDLEYSIPEPDIKLYVEYLYNYFDFNDFFRVEVRIQNSKLNDESLNFKIFNKAFFSYRNLTLRQLEKIYVLAHTGLHSFKLNNYTIPSAFTFLVYLRICEGKIYTSILNKQLSIQEFITHIEAFFPLSFITDDERRVLLFFEAQTLVLYNNYLLKNRYNEHSDLMVLNDKNETLLNFKSNFDKSTQNRDFIEAIEYYSKRVEWNRMSIDFLTNKINLLEQIKK